MTPQLMVNIFLKGDRAHLPVLGLTRDGYFADTGDLITTECAPDAISSALAQLRARGNPRIPNPDPNATTPVQEALGTKSYRKMAKDGVVCAVVAWYKDQVTVAFSAQGAKDVQLIDYNNRVVLPANADLAEIATAVVEECGRRAA